MSGIMEAIIVCACFAVGIAAAWVVATKLAEASNRKAAERKAAEKEEE